MGCLAWPGLVNWLFDEKIIPVIPDQNDKKEKPVKMLNVIIVVLRPGLLLVLLHINYHSPCHCVCTRHQASGHHNNDDIHNHINKHLHLTHTRIIQVKPFTLSASEYKGKALTFSLAITWDLQILTSSLLFSLLNIYSNLQSANTERVRELRDKFGQNHGPRWLMIRNVMSLYSDLYYRINLTASSHKPLN